MVGACFDCVEEHKTLCGLEFVNLAKDKALLQ